MEKGRCQCIPDQNLVRLRKLITCGADTLASVRWQHMGHLAIEPKLMVPHRWIQNLQRKEMLMRKWYTTTTTTTTRIPWDHRWKVSSRMPAPHNSCRISCNSCAKFSSLSTVVCGGVGGGGDVVGNGSDDGNDWCGDTVIAAAVAGWGAASSAAVVSGAGDPGLEAIVCVVVMSLCARPVYTPNSELHKFSHHTTNAMHTIAAMMMVMWWVVNNFFFVRAIAIAIQHNEVMMSVFALRWVCFFHCTIWFDNYRRLQCCYILIYLKKKCFALKQIKKIKIKRIPTCIKKDCHWNQYYTFHYWMGNVQPNSIQIDQKYIFLLY